MTQIPSFLPFLSYCTESCHIAWSLHKGYTPFPWARTSRDRAPPSWCYLQIQKRKGKEKVFLQACDCCFSTVMGRFVPTVT